MAEQDEATGEAVERCPSCHRPWPPPQHRPECDPNACYCERPLIMEENDG